MKSVIILGAGMVGVSTALALKDRGWHVSLVDRKTPGRETSFGNAGIIQSESVEPYAMPTALSEIARIALGRTNDVYFTYGQLPSHINPLLRYWWNSLAPHHRKISLSYASLINRAIATHDALIRRAGADNLIRRSGYRTLYRNQAKYDKAIANAARIRAIYGVDSTLLSESDIRAAEPALKTGGVGAIHWTGPWSAADPGALAASYADLFARSGGTIAEGDALTLARRGTGWSVETRGGRLEAEHVVIALGPWSAGLSRAYGHRFVMVQKRGYHAHYRSSAALSAPIMDTEAGYVLAPMSAGLRITTGAHLASFDAKPVYRQLERAEIAANQLVELGARVEDTPWMGTRPCTSDMLPVIGQSAGAPNLWMNFGHGHQGFTLGPATGELLAMMMDGEKPPIDMRAFAPGRY